MLVFFIINKTIFKTNVLCEQLQLTINSIDHSTLFLQNKLSNVMFFVEEHLGIHSPSHPLFIALAYAPLKMLFYPPPNLTL